MSILRNLIMAQVGGSSSRLPSEYQEVEYLESNGRCYIDTQFIDTNAIKIYFKTEFITLPSSTSVYLFGSWNNIGISTRYSNNFTLETPSGASPSQIKQETNKIYKIEAYFTSNGTCYLTIDGNTVVTRGNTTAIKVTPTIRLYNYYTSIANSNLRIYEAKIYDSNNELNQVLVPCYRISDNVAGMYDLVSGQFFTNQGSGEFIVGADVNQ